MVAQDRCLHETTDPRSPRMPPFHHTQSNRHGISQLNVFLVIINAEIKFRRYFQMVHKVPLIPLAEDVLSLMHCTIDLVELIYWRPLPNEGTKGYRILAEIQAYRQRNERMVARQQASDTMLDEGNEEIDIEDDENVVLTHTSVRSVARQYAHVQQLLGGDIKT